MIIVRRAEDRGETDQGWLKSKHSFSFGNFYDSDFKGLGPLRAINEDLIEAGTGYGTQARRDMGIMTVVLSGQLEYRENNKSPVMIKRGVAQLILAGHGVQYSEYNASKEEPLHLIQVWIQPQILGLKPNYVYFSFSDFVEIGKITPLPKRALDALKADLKIYAGSFAPGQSAEMHIESGTTLWVHMMKGRLTVAGARLRSGDGAKIADQNVISFTEGENAEVLIFSTSTPLED